MQQTNKQQIHVPDSTQQGFSLLELLVVLGVLGILSTVIAVVINPSEVLKKSRDSQRISDLESVSRALTQYVESVPTPHLDWDDSGSCLTSEAGFSDLATIGYSALSLGSPECLYDIAEGADATADFASGATSWCVYRGSPSIITGTGWVHVDFTSIPGGSPIAALPLDPINTVQNQSAPSSSDLTYRFACQEITTGNLPPYTFELNAALESKYYTQTDNRLANDGGDNNNYYETGSSTKLIGTGTNY